MSLNVKKNFCPVYRNKDQFFKLRFVSLQMEKIRILSDKQKKYAFNLRAIKKKSKARKHDLYQESA